LVKKHLLALAGMASVAVAHAQSSVTLYGLIDEGVNYQSNAGGKRLYNMSAGELNGSRWGLRGREDLGGGLEAIFLLENGFDENTGKLGQGGLEFGRQAYVGISGGAGSVTFGRQYDSVVDYVNPFAVANTWGGTFLAHPGDVDQLAHTNRTNNSIKFKSGEIGGLTFGGMYSLGGVAGDYTRNQIFSLGAGYSRGPFSAGVGYLNVRDPNVSFWGDTGAPAPVTGAVPGANFAGSPVTTGFASAHTLQTIAGGANIQVGQFLIGGNYANTKFTALGNTTAGPVPAGGISGTATFNTGELNVTWHATTALALNAAYSYTQTSGVTGFTGAKYQQAALDLSYFLSKGTVLYVLGVYQKVSGVDSTGHEAVASIYTLSPSTSNHEAVLRLGIEKKF
jgi:predicted porin